MKKERSVTVFGLVIACMVAPSLGQAWDDPQVKVQSQADSTTLLRPQTADANRSLAIRSLASGTLGDYRAEPRTRDGHVDIPRLLNEIQAAHMTMHDFLIW
jgi:photosystem II stability/assembly factor-like uncharacterized protein